MQHIDRSGELHGVNRPVSIAIVVFDDFKDARASETFQRFRGYMLAASLSPAESEAHNALDLIREFPKIIKG
jgi:hypothetical protein